MVNVRGVNVYPSAVEAVVRRFGEVAEYRATVASQRLAARAVGGDRADAGGVEHVGRRRACRAALRESLGLTVPVQVVDAGTPCLALR